MTQAESGRMQERGYAAELKTRQLKESRWIPYQWLKSGVPNKALSQPITTSDGKEPTPPTA